MAAIAGSATGFGEYHFPYTREFTLGVAGLIHSSGKWIPVPGEGGHMDIGPRTPRDYQIFPHIEPIEGRISGEQILCGRGLVNVYRAVAKADGKPAPFTTPDRTT